MTCSFAAVLQGTSTGPTGIEVPDQVIDELGGGKRPAVMVDVNGYTFTSTVGVMGGKCMIPFSSAHRTASGIKAGDEIQVQIKIDSAPREVEVPDELAAALTKVSKLEAFASLAPSRRKEHVRQVVEAKTQETRTRRIERIVESL